MVIVLTRLNNVIITFTLPECRAWIMAFVINSLLSWFTIFHRIDNGINMTLSLRFRKINYKEIR